MQATLDRLADLTAELRRQLKPLGRQAEVARRAAGVQADLRDARLRILADDLVQLRDALDRDVADETAAREDRKSTRLNSSHANISYAVFCLKKNGCNSWIYLGILKPVEVEYHASIYGTTDTRNAGRDQRDIVGKETREMVVNGLMTAGKIIY